MLREMTLSLSSMLATSLSSVLVVFDNGFRCNIYIKDVDVDVDCLT